MGFKEKLEVLVDANVGGFVRGMEQAGASAEKNLGKTDDRVKRMSAGLTTWGVAALGASAVAAVGLGKLASMAGDAQVQQLKLTNSIQNSSKAYKDNGQALRDQASALQKITAADDEAIVSMQATLVQFGLTEDQVKTLTPLVVDLSRKMGIDMSAAAKAVGKAVDGNGGILARYGIQLDKASLSADGFGTVVDGLRSRVGGYATAEGKTFSGQLEITKNLLREIGEGVGGGVLDVVTPFAKLGATLGDVNPDLTNTVGRILTLGTAGVAAAGGVSFVAGQVIKLKDTLPGVSAAIAGLGVGSTAGLAAVGVGIGVIASKAFESKSSVEELDAAITKFAASGNIDDTRTAINNLADDLQSNIDPFEGFFVTITQGAGFAAKAVDDAAPAYQNLIDIATSNPAQGQLLVDALSQRTDILTNASFKALGGLDGLNKAIADGKQLAQGAAQLSQDNADALTNEGDAASGAADAWTKYAAAIKSATDPFFAAQDASTKFAASQRDLAEAQAEIIKQPTADNMIKLSKAQDGAVRSGLDFQSAMAGLRAEIEKNPAATDQAIATLEELKAQQPQLAAEIGKTEDAVRSYSTQAEAVPESKATAFSNNADAVTPKVKDLNFFTRAVPGLTPVNFSTNADAVRASIQGVIAAARVAASVGRDIANIQNQLNNYGLGGADGNPATPYAKGGTFRAGELMLVGEKGPELARFGTGGTIIPNHKLKAGSGTAIGSDGATSGGLTVNFYGPVTDEQWVIDAISKANRRGMTSLAP